MVIYKYELEITDVQTIKMPRRACPISVGHQNGKLVVWCGVNTNAAVAEHTFYVVGTGNPMPNDGAYMEPIGTVQMPNGLVWHVFKGTK